MWDAVSSGLKTQPWHHNVIWAPPYPNFLKFGPHLHSYNGVRVNQYAQPQHMKVLKHFISSSLGDQVALAAICLVFPVLVLGYKSFNVSMCHVPVPM